MGAGFDWEQAILIGFLTAAGASVWTSISQDAARDSGRPPASPWGRWEYAIDILSGIMIGAFNGAYYTRFRREVLVITVVCLLILGVCTRLRRRYLRQALLP
jgi:ribose/xylose/arabinose/galactoside ABC-type transport system permease subunit